MRTFAAIRERQILRKCCSANTVGVLSLRKPYLQWHPSVLLPPPELAPVWVAVTDHSLSLDFMSVVDAYLPALYEY